VVVKVDSEPMDLERIADLVAPILSRGGLSKATDFRLALHPKDAADPPDQQLGLSFW
jgi:hypothetical protein